MANGPLGLEHPLVCSRDLDALATRYRALGFAPAPKGLHPWGTGTQLVMFPDNFIELMGIEDRSRIDVTTPPDAPGGFRFGRFIADFLDRREGIAMVALHSRDARADLAALQARGVPSAGVVDFRRAVRLPDGRAGEAVVTLGMLIDTTQPQLSYFVCHQHRPELVWVPDWLQHPNGALAISQIIYAAADPASVRLRFAAIWGASAMMPEPGRFRVTTAGGDFLVLNHSTCRERYAGIAMPDGWDTAPCAIAIGVRVSTLEPVLGHLSSNNVPAVRKGGTVVVGPPHAGQVILEFSE
jgi:Glyoxalase-like domain